ncbi:MAG: AmmeMemoRadiSam system protein B [Thermodesulfovibrionales bacterium]
MKRAPAVAGQFYHGSAERLCSQVDQYIDAAAPKTDAIGIMVPHAGLVYSGAVAGAVYSAIRFPSTFVMLGPNHTGLGSAVAVMDEGSWDMPTGSVEVDRKLARSVLHAAPVARRDSRAHMFEHSLEVQLPFLIRFSPDVRIVPVALMSAGFDECMQLADGIAKAVRTADYPVVILASSDMSHYLPDKEARRKDKKALDRLLALDPPGLYTTVREERISMCGYLPATVMLAAARMLGAKTARLVKYMTSGDVSGDYEGVVGYAGVVVS